MNYSYWNVWYLSCEGNRRWTTARTPDTWSEDEVESAFPLGGMGDEPAQLISIEEYYPNPNDEDCDYTYDLTD
jgi:hypothetical protein